jgi:hypothetical protein
MRQESKEKTGEKYKLRQKWIKRAQMLFPSLIYQFLSHDDFNQQPPKTQVAMCFVFHCNYGTFMPIGPPVIRPLDPDAQKELECNFERAKATHTSNKQRTHSLKIVFQNDVENLMYTIDPDTVTDYGREFGLSPTTEEYCHEDFCKILQGVELKKSLHDPESDRAIKEANLTKQFNFFQDYRDGIHVPWSRFVLNAYRTNEKKNLKNSHAVIVYFLFDFIPGKIQRFTRYDVVSIDTAKRLVPPQVQRAYLCLDQPNFVPVLMVEDWSKDLFAVSSQVGLLPKGFQCWNKETSDEAAEQYFQILKDLTFPNTGLHIPPSLG